MSSPLWQIPLYALGGVAAVLFVLYLVRLVHERGARRLEPEGILRRTGRVRIQLRLRGYRGPVVRRSSQFSIRTGELVLTKQRLVLLMPYLIPIAAPPWTSLRVEVRGGKLLVETTDPLEATGGVEVLLKAPDPEAWVAALAPNV